jgi:hypothetical protein
MLLKAARTRSLRSYSLSHLVMNNVANLVHWVYVLSLPPGPLWVLHGFYSVSTLLMLIWYLHFESDAHDPAVNAPVKRVPPHLLDHQHQRGAPCSTSRILASAIENVRAGPPVAGPCARVADLPEGTVATHRPAVRLLGEAPRSCTSSAQAAP